MKLKTVCGILGVVVLFAGATYFIIKYFSDSKKESKDVEEAKKEATSLIVPEEKKLDDTIELNIVKQETVQMVNERHEEAKKVMEEAVKNIMSSAAPETTKNEDQKKKLFNDIDKL